MQATTTRLELLPGDSPEILEALRNSGACSPTNRAATLAELLLPADFDVPDLALVMVDTTGYWDSLARRICTLCDLQPACLTYALVNPTVASFGIWGALDEKERRRYRRRQLDKARRERRRLERRD